MRSGLTVTRQDDPGETRLRLEGALDVTSAPELRILIDDLVAQKPAKVVVDLSALRLIDSSGVGTLVSLYKRLKTVGGKLVLEGVRDQPRQILQLLNLDRILGA
jgi:anti-sigma B factor antagonist